MDYQLRTKTPIDHHRDVVAIAQQQLALACAQSLCEPENKKWLDVINRLSDWVERLQSDERRYASRRSVMFPEAVETADLPH